jgi:hypothetical protein
MKRIFAVASILALAASPAFAAGGDHMSGADLGAAVSGKTIQGNMRGSGNYTEYYAPDGTVKGKDYTGNWRIDDNDRLCVSYSTDPTESCWHGRVENNNVTWMRDGVEDGMGAINDGDNGGFRDDDRSRR